MASPIDKFNLNRAQSRRAKATDEDVAEMRRLYSKGLTQKAIAEMFNMSQSAVSYIVSLKARENLKKYRQKNPPKKRTREEAALYMRDLRKYKRDLIKGGGEIDETHQAG